MHPLYVASTSPLSGKSLLALGLALELKAAGLRVGYMKPYGTFPIPREGGLADQDAAVAKEVLGLEEPLQDLCPVLLTRDLLVRAVRGEAAPDARAAIEAAYARVSASKDAVILGGPGKLVDGAMFDCSALWVAKRLRARVVLVDRYEADVSGHCLDCIVAAREALGDLLVGAVLNRVDPASLELVTSMVPPFLARRGVPVFGTIPEEPAFRAIPVGELAEALGATFAAAAERKDLLVENFAVGAMDLDDALRRFRRVAGKAVIVGGSRADLIAAALETDLRCLVLTGGVLPPVHVLARARERAIPVLSTPDDTIAAVRKADRAVSLARIASPEKVARARALVRERLDVPALRRAMGLA